METRVCYDTLLVSPLVSTSLPMLEVAVWIRSSLCARLFVGQQDVEQLVQRRMMGPEVLFLRRYPPVATKKLQVIELDRMLLLVAPSSAQDVVRFEVRTEGLELRLTTQIVHLALHVPGAAGLPAEDHGGCGCVS